MLLYLVCVCVCVCVCVARSYMCAALRHKAPASHIVCGKLRASHMRRLANEAHASHAGTAALLRVLVLCCTSSAAPLRAFCCSSALQDKWIDWAEHREGGMPPTTAELHAQSTGTGTGVFDGSAQAIKSILKGPDKQRPTDSVRLISEFRQEKKRGQKLKAMFAPPVQQPEAVIKANHRRRFVSTRDPTGKKVTRMEKVTVNPATEMLKQNLARKLSSRCSVKELRNRKVLTRFSDYNEVESAAVYVDS